jgi:hypothetical protein
MKYLLSVFFFPAIYFLAIYAQGQSNPLPLGTWTSNGSASCSGFQKNAACESLTISCPNADPINVTVGTVTETLGKTVLYANGSEGTTPGGSGYGIPLVKAGYTFVAFEWASPWQEGPGNMLTAACRPATLFNYVASKSDGGQIAVIAASAGAGALAYALSWYGASFVSAAFITSGPPYTVLGQGCETPKAEWVPWQSALNFMQGTQPLMSTFTGQTCEPKSDTTQLEYQNWEAQSILAPGAEFPFLYIYGQLCSNAPEANNSTGQASLWLGPMGAWVVAISGCSGSEETTVGLTPAGENGQTALIAAVEAQW